MKSFSQAMTLLRKCDSYSDIPIVITIAELFREWLCSYSFWNKGKSFRQLFLCQNCRKTYETHSTETVPRRCSVKNGFLNVFTKFTRKHLCGSFFFNIVAGWSSTTLLKKTRHKIFPVNFEKLIKTKKQNNRHQSMDQRGHV